ncbi:S-DNA-T family DNA segregation ATPase FtsK/SpoIIIE [Desulfofundulus luciae]|uniref:S-DNA-T family DNA segregation ATPase FtsK/SpoIIIE n=1 Tax=Desulfofundulus luciae TaxID=74702 RepID=A0ABU0B0U8_9FIRM|nr:DNA translocase FtsK [Desulfofundulus luciae]MDQ0286347.1 S-DNA-T family DNA segregation ATPase FtsK/SpoIIIE [Desulfofundulus luciae]
MKVRPVKDRQKYELSGIGLICVSLLALISLVNPTVGLVSLGVERVLRGIAGEGRYLFPLLLAFWGLRLVRGKAYGRAAGRRFYGGALLFVVALTLLHMLVPQDYSLEAGLAGEGGGLVGAVCYFLLERSFGFTGTYVVLATLTLMGVLLSSNVSLSTLLARLMRALKSLYERVGGLLFTEAEEIVEEPDPGPVIIDQSGPGISTGEAASPEVAGEKPGNSNAGNTGMTRALRIVPSPVYPSGETAGEKEVSSGSLPYQFPPLSLLSKPARPKSIKNSRDITENIRILEETLSSFGVKARVVQVSRGPAITRYEIQPPAGIKVSRIVGLADDIALSMAAPDVRIEAPIPGKAAVGIEVPNREVSMVYLRELLETLDFQQAPSRLTVALGKDITGNPVVTDLARMPHLLIAGATGSGKSVCLNTVIASILFKATPDEVKFLIIDPKMVELSTYNGIPHLVSPVVTDPRKAATSLRWAVKEMEHRYELFAAAGVRDITRYNELCRSQETGMGARGPLPLIVIIIDELADLMMVAPADVEDAVCRLAQMARAAGIHLVVATQRPSVDVITGLIKANIPSRISFAVSSQIDSRTILDMAGAEKLLGKGDMLFFPVGAPKPIRVQGAYLSDQEVEALVSFLKKQAAPHFEAQVVHEEDHEEQEKELEDELLPRAVEIFIETGHASISLLQRRLRVGYARAARLMDIMERQGIVGGYEGSKPRSVLITLEQFKQTFKKKVN